MMRTGGWRLRVGVAWGGEGRVWGGNIHWGITRTGGNQMSVLDEDRLSRPVADKIRGAGSVRRTNVCCRQ